MKVIIIGANGTIGKAITEQLASRHDVIEVGRRSGQFQADISNIESVESLFSRIGHADAVIVAAGDVHFGPLAELTPRQFAIGLHSKLMGQIHVALVAQRYLNHGGSITLTSGITGDEPIRHGVNATTVNAAIEGFARSAALELERGLRINVVNPTVLQESMDAYGAYFRGFEPAPASRVALAYSKSVEGLQTGRVYKVW